MGNEKFSQVADIIVKESKELKSLNSEEKEIALKILEDLAGTTVIRATSILDLCKILVQYSKIH